jgi:beta-lactam-binding protein with PASTA domain
MKRFANALAKLGLLMLLGALTAFVVVKIVVSRGGMAVPDLRGTDVVAALELAHQQGFGLQITARHFNTTLPSNAILTQDPKAGSWLHREGIVRVVVGTGIGETAVPAVEGLAWQDAKATLERGGARLGDILRIHSDRVPRERVIAQSPPGDAKVVKGGPVTLLISEGPWPVSYVMPDVRGVSRSGAEAIVTAIGLSLRDPTEIDRPDARAGSVVDQQPSPGQRVALGQEVRLVLATREIAPTSRAGTVGDPPVVVAPPPVYRPPSPAVVVPPVAPQMYWYYCHSPAGYYPYEPRMTLRALSWSK